MAQKIAFSLEIKGIDGQVQALNKIEQELKKVTASRNELIKTQKTEKGLTEQETKKLTALTKEQIRLKNEKQKAVKVTKDNIRGINALKGSYTQISAAMSTNLTRWKHLTASERANDKVGGQLLRTIQKQDAALKRLDTQVGKSGRKVGSYTASIKRAALSVGGALGLTAGLAGLFRAFGNIIKRIKAFDKEMQNMAGISGTSRIELKAVETTIREIASSSTKHQTSCTIGNYFIHFG